MELQYRGSDGRIDVLQDREALCDAAGCQCHGPSVTCGHTDGVFYEPVFSQVYGALCFHLCHCDLMPPSVDDGKLSRLEMSASKQRTQS